MTERIVRRAPPDEVARLGRLVKMAMASERTRLAIAELRERDRLAVFLRRVFGQPDTR